MRNTTEALRQHSETLSTLKKGLGSLAGRIQRNLTLSSAEVLEKITESFQNVLHYYVKDQLQLFTNNAYNEIRELQGLLAKMSEAPKKYAQMKFYQDLFEQKSSFLSYLLSNKVQIRIKKNRKSIAKNVFDSLGLKVFVKDNLVIEKAQTLKPESMNSSRRIKKVNTYSHSPIYEKQEFQESPPISEEQEKNKTSEGCIIQQEEKIEESKKEEKNQEPDEIKGVASLIKAIKSDFEGKSIFEIPKEFREKEKQLKTIKLLVDQAWSDDPTTIMSSMLQLSNSWKGYFLAHDALDRWFSHPGVEWLTPAQFHSSSGECQGLPYAQFTYQAHVHTRTIKVQEVLRELKEEMEQHNIRSIEIINQV